MKSPGGTLRGLLLGAALALPCLCAAHGPARAWSLARSAHFTLFTDAAEGDARARIRDLETLHTILQVITPDLRRPALPATAGAPAYVYLFSRSKDYQDHAPGQGTDGFFLHHPDGLYIAMDLESGDGAGVAFHEYLHQYLDANAPGTPLWLNEGLATFFQTLAFADQTARLGSPPEGYLQTLYGVGLLPAARILAMGNRSPAYLQPGPDRQRFYASAWLLTDWLLTSSEARRAQLGAFLDLVRHGRDPGEAFRSAFALEPGTLDKELKEYLEGISRRHTVPVWDLRFHGLTIDAAFTFQPLSRSETLGRLGLLLSLGPPETLQKARRDCREALDLDPECASASLAMALVEMQASRLGEAAPFFIRAAQAWPDNAQIQFLAAVSLIRRGSPDAGGRPVKEANPDLLQARRLLLRALQLGNAPPEAPGLLGGLVLQCEPARPEDFAVLQEACRLVPGNWDLRQNLAELYEKAGRLDLALPALEELAAQTEDPRSASFARSRLQERRMKEAGTLHDRAVEAFKAGRYPESESLMEQALARTEEGAQRTAWADELERMKVLIRMRSRTPRPRG